MRLLVRTLAAVALAALLTTAAAGCGEEDVQREVGRVREQVKEFRGSVEKRIERAERQFERRRRRYGRRIREVLAELEPLFERPERTNPTVRSRGRNDATTIDAFLTDLLQQVDRYWTRTFREAGLPLPRVSYNWVPAGRVTRTACGNPAGPDAAFYCPADDTIYVSQSFAAELYEGVAEGLPGQNAGYGRAAGDFAVAYVVSHEYAHNLQQELGVFNNRESPTAKPFELQADCMAGTWSYSVFAAGDLKPGDLEEATNAALAVGDFDVGNEQHHGTPRERRDALLTGFRSGDPSVCQRYLPT